MHDKVAWCQKKGSDKMILSVNLPDCWESNFIPNFHFLYLTYKVNFNHSSAGELFKILFLWFPFVEIEISQWSEIFSEGVCIDNFNFHKILLKFSFNLSLNVSWISLKTQVYKFWILLQKECCIICVMTCKNFNKTLWK